MNGLRVGVLSERAGRVLEFAYATDWLSNQGAIPLSLSIPLRESPARGEVVENWFDNLLPDDQELRERMRTTVGADSTRAIDLLAEVGRDCVGAVQLVDIEEDLPDVRGVRGEPLTESSVAELLGSLPRRTHGMLPDRRDFRISVAGAQHKTALLWNSGQWHRPIGPTPTTHLLKPAIGRLPHGLDLADSVENEWLCSRILAGFGLPVADAHMERFEGLPTLVVERFDRTWAEDRSWIARQPQEDFCQALGLSRHLKYEADGGPGIADGIALLRRTLDPMAAMEGFFRTQVLFWLLAGIDGHAKNFSLHLHPGGASRPTPSYDVLSAWPSVARGELHERELKLAMAAVGDTRRQYSWSRIGRRHWSSTARLARFPVERADAIVDESLASAPDVADRVATELPPDFPQSVAEPILSRLRAAPSMR